MGIRGEFQCTNRHLRGAAADCQPFLLLTRHDHLSLDKRDEITHGADRVCVARWYLESQLILEFEEEIDHGQGINTKILQSGLGGDSFSGNAESIGYFPSNRIVDV